MIGTRLLVLRVARWGILLVALGLVAMVAIHLPPVRDWLAANGHRGGGFCPLGYSSPSPAKLAAQRGTVPANARPALGFELDRSTADDIDGWATENDLACTTKYAGRMIECANVPASLLGGTLAATSIWFEIGARGTLRSIKTARRNGDVETVAEAYEEADRALARTGAVWRRTGSASPSTLANGALRQAACEYRFTDYRATVRATNMGDGFLLTEEYATLVD